MTMPSTTQRISPVLVYDDADAAIGFLAEALGFTLHTVHRDDAGVVVHAELAFDGAYVGLSERRPGESSVFDLGPCAVYVTVDEVDAHHDRAVAAGAEVVHPLSDQDYGSRDYAVRDPEGNVWCFGTFALGSDPTG